MLLGGCAGPGVPEPAYAAAELEEELVCRALDPDSEGGLGQITQIAASGDTAVIVLSGDARTVILIGSDFRERWRMTLEAEGPTGVAAPMGVALVEDSLLHVSDARRYLIRRLSLAGDDRGTIDVSFPVRELLVTPAGLAALRFLAPGNGEGLLTLLAEDTERSAGPPPHPFADVRLRSLANTMAFAVSRTGEILLAHKLIVPLLYRVDPFSGEFVRHHLVVPREARGKFRAVPRLDRGQRAAREFLLPAYAIAESPGSDDLLYVAGTGRWVDEAPQWAILRVSPGMELRAARRLPFSVEGFATLAAAGAAVVGDEQGGLHACPLDW